MTGAARTTYGSVRPTPVVAAARQVVFTGPWLPTLLRRAGDWLDDHYYDGNPQAVLIECEDNYPENWSLTVVQDV